MKQTKQTKNEKKLAKTQTRQKKKKKKEEKKKTQQQNLSANGWHKKRVKFMA